MKIAAFVLFSFSILFCVRTATAEDTIKIGWIGPLTGPAAALEVDGAESARRNFDEINGNGGIHGRKIRVCC